MTVGGKGRSDETPSGRGGAPGGDSDALLRAIAGVPARIPPEADPEQVGRYRIIARLGKGGMGIVYRAEDDTLRRPVALKVLPRAVSDDEDRRRRFLREARSAAAINHPNVATIHEIGESGGRVFIVMELVEGHTLRHELSVSSLPLPKALRIARAVARGLAKAHDKGIVHRDLKPENVMIAADGEVKILDFGLAKLGDPPSGSTLLENSPTQSHLTAEGHVLGTPGYMAPEQARGGEIDARTDVFSFGVLFYEMLAGEKPFEGRAAGEQIAALLRDTPAPLRERNGQVSPGLAAVVERCLAKAPGDRYASALEALEALDGAIADNDSRPTPAHAKSLSRSAVRTSRRLAAGVFAGILVAAIILAAWAINGTRAAPTAAAPSASAAAARGVAITDTPPPRTSSAQAASEFAAAMQLFRDASIPLAAQRLEHAVTLDPGFAAAHLWIASRGEDLDVQRKHLGIASQYRSLLDERDAAMLEAFQADAATDRPDYEARAQRWRALVDRFPLDASIMHFAGILVGVHGEHAEEGLALLDRAIALDPKFALPYHEKADYFFQMRDYERATLAANKCLAISPGAASCLRRRADVEAARGEVAKLEEDARSMIAVESDSPLAYEFLAEALESRAAPVESVVHALQLRQAVVFGMHAIFAGFLDPTVAPAWLSGDFEGVIARFPDWEKVRLTTTSDRIASDVTRSEILVFTEAGQPERALAVADDYTRRLPALTADDPADARSCVLALRRRLGRISGTELRTQREAWMKETQASLTSRSANSAWFEFYASVRTAPEAREALDVLAEYTPLPAYTGDLGSEETMGRILLLAGKAEEAAPHLRSAFKACFHPSMLHQHVWAAEELGEVLAAEGDKDGACAAFGEAVARWGNAKPRSVTVDAARSQMRKLGCAK